MYVYVASNLILLPSNYNMTCVVLYDIPVILLQQGIEFIPVKLPTNNKVFYGNTIPSWYHPVLRTHLR